MIIITKNNLKGDIKMATKLEIDKAKKEVRITLPLIERTSKSGKSTVIASTDGNVPFPVEYKGKPVTCGVNCYIPKPKK